MELKDKPNEVRITVIYDRHYGAWFSSASLGDYFVRFAQSGEEGEEPSGLRFNTLAWFWHSHGKEIEDGGHS